MRKRVAPDWELNAVLRKDRESRYVKPKRNPDRDDHICYYENKKHCRICGQRELTNWLHNAMFSKPCTGFDEE